MFVRVADYRLAAAMYVGGVNWLNRVIAWSSKNGRTVDILLFVAFTIPGVLSTALVPLDGSEIRADALAYFLAVAAAATLLWRRTHPLIALPACVLFVVIFWIRDYAGGLDAVLWLQFYNATRHGGPDRRRVWRVVGASLLVNLTVATIGVIVPTEDLPIVAIIGIFFVLSTTASIGEALYQRSKYVAELEQRAAGLEAELKNKAALAAAEERTRIAREMHDIIAHGMSTVVVQAQAGQSVVDTDPEQARQVLRSIEGIGRDSVDEMRRMLGVLREGATEAELVPQPGFDDLETLRRSAEDAGIQVDIAVSGESRPLPPGLELTGYRVVQESLTNVARHAGRPVRAEAEITYGADTLEIRVSDDGLGAAATTDAASPGHGLLGMCERVEIYNGSCETGPRAGGGFEVNVSLPIPKAVVT